MTGDGLHEPFANRAVPRKETVANLLQVGYNGENMHVWMKGVVNMTIKILTDSGSDLPREIVEEYGIEVVPLLVYLDDQEYLDGVTMDSKTLFDGMRAGRVYKTGQVTLNQFREVFTGYAERGESCIYIAFSSELSGTYQSAELVRNQLLQEYPNLDLDIVDTKCASLGFGMVVLKAAQMAREGYGKPQILEAIRFYSRHMEHIFTVDNLEYLYRGGRVSRTQALIGGLLNIKPVLQVEEGRLVPLEKTRGRRKVLERIADIMGERGVDLDKQLIGISHGDDPAAVEWLQQLLRDKYGCQRFITSMIGCAIGAHAGPGTIALFFLNEREPEC